MEEAADHIRVERPLSSQIHRGGTDDLKAPLVLEDPGPEFKNVGIILKLVIRSLSC